MIYYAKYIFILLILFVMGAIYEKYKKGVEKEDMMNNYDLIQKYLLNESTLAKSDKPILWIHVTLETNARWWGHFASRNSTCLNQPYQYLTIKSIIDKCGESFNVCLLDDKSFNSIIPGWSTKIQNLPNPLRPHLRQLAMTKLLYNYGGMTIPSSFICFKDLKPLYNESINSGCMFVSEMPSKSNVAQLTEFFPSNLIMGCEKECKFMNDYTLYLEQLVSNDYTNEMDFTGETDKWLYKEILNKNVMIVDGKKFGTKTVNNEPVIIDELISDSEINIDKSTYGVYIPQNEILQRTNFQWFARQSPEQVLESNTMIGKYILLST